MIDQIRIGGAAGHFSVSSNGIMAFANAGDDVTRPLLVVNRLGVPAGPPIASGTIGGPQPSPDGRKVLFLRSPIGVRNGGDVYMRDLDRGTETRLTFSERLAVTPVWSPDGLRFAYVQRSADGRSVVRTQAADGLGTADSLSFPAGMSVSLTGWSADGSRLFGYDINAARSFALPLGGPARNPQFLIDSTLRVVQSVVSPDGLWIAAATGSQPNFMIVVFSLSGVSGRWQVSSVPGINPRWTKNGRELIYEGWTVQKLMAVDIDTRSGFHAGTPHELFALPGRSFSHEVGSWNVDASGERFLIVGRPQTPTNAGIVELVTRFQDLVSRR